MQTELEFRVGDDDAARGGVVGRSRVNHESEIAKLRGEFPAHDLRHALVRNVLVMAGFCFRGRRENRLTQLAGELQSTFQPKSADGPRLLVLLPSGPDEI